MAIKTIIYRPIADTTLGHTPNAGSDGYPLLSESTADNDSTYISQSISSTTSASVTSEFTCQQGIAIPMNGIVVAARVHIIGEKTQSSITATLSASVNIGGTKTEIITDNALTTSYSDSTAGVSGLQMPAGVVCRVSITTKGNTNQIAKTSGEIRITQIYVEVDFEIPSTGLYFKQNNTYKEAQNIYKKINSEWIAVDKNAIDSSLQTLIKPI